MPTFSIIVPVYNVEKYLTKCIDSILEQTFSDFEVILVDDGSTDNCGIICDQYVEKDDRIQVIHKKNEGLVCARKTGISKASGQYILNVDSDDYISLDLLERVAKIISTNAPDIIAFDYYDVSEGGDILREVKNTLPEGMYTGDVLNKIKSTLIYDTESSHINTGCLIYNVWSKFVRRDLMIKCQLKVPEQIKYGEDLAVVMPAVCKAKSLYIDSFYGYYYLQRMNSIVHSFDESEVNKVCVLVDFLQQNTNGIPRKNIQSCAFRMFLGQLIKAAKYFDCYKNFKKYADEKLSLSIISTAVMDFQQKKIRFSGQLVVKIIKHRCWFLFWLIYHR